MPSNAIMNRGSLVYRIERIEEEIFNRTSGRSLENSSIGAGGLDVLDGGSIEIDGGELRLISDEGVTVARWGDVFFGGEASRGWEMNYPDGSAAFILGGSADHPIWTFWDRAGNYIMSNDGLSGYGLARPYLNYRMVPSFGAKMATGVADGPFWPFTNSTAFTEMFHGINAIQHPRIAFGIGTSTTGGETEWQLLIDNTVIASGTGSGGEYDIPGWGDEITPAGEHNLRVMVRNTTGDMSWVQVDKCYGRES